MSIAKAQIQALRDSFIQSLGGSFDKYKPGELPVLEDTLALYGKAFNDKITEILDKENITVDESYELTTIQFLNTLSYLKAKADYDKEQHRKLK